MAKEIKFNGGTKLAGFILALLVTIGTVLGTWSDHKGDARELKTTVETHIKQSETEGTKSHAEGCLPSRKNTTSVTVIKAEISGIKKAIEDSRIEQKEQIQQVMDKIDSLK